MKKIHVYMHTKNMSLEMGTCVYKFVLYPFIILLFYVLFIYPRRLNYICISRNTNIIKRTFSWERERKLIALKQKMGYVPKF